MLHKYYNTKVYNYIMIQKCTQYPKITVDYIQQGKSSNKLFEVGISFKAVHKVTQNLVTQYILLLKNEESKLKLQTE